MTINDEMKIRELYKSKTDDELRSELERLNADPFGTFDFNNNDISHFNLKKVLKRILDERDPNFIESVPSFGSNIQTFEQQQRASHEAGRTVVAMFFGVLLIAVGVVLTMASEGHFIVYGPIVLGIVILFHGLVELT